MVSPSADGHDESPAEGLASLLQRLDAGAEPRHALRAILETVRELLRAGGARLVRDDPWNPGRPEILAESGGMAVSTPDFVHPLGGDDAPVRLELRGVSTVDSRLLDASRNLLALQVRLCAQADGLRRHELAARCSEQIVARMAAGRPDAELFETLTRGFAELFGLDRVAAFTLSEDHGWLIPEAIHDTRPAGAGRTAVPSDPALCVDEEPRIALLFREGHLIEVDDVEAGGIPEPWLRMARARQVAAIMALPLADVRGSWGLLLLARALPGPVLTGADREAARLLLQQIAPLLQNSRVMRQQQRNVESFRALLDSSRELSAVLDLWEIPRRVAMKGLELSEADESLLYALDDDGRTLRPVFAVSDDEETLMANTARVGQGLAGRVAESRRGAFENRGNPEADRVAERRTTSRLAVPLVCADELVGVLVLNRRGGREFGDFDLAMATVFATQAAIALENARLFQRVANERTRISTMIDQLEEAVLFCDSDGVLLLVNPAAHRWLRRPAAVEGLALIDAAPPEARAELAGAAAALRSGRERNVTREVAVGGRVDLVSLTAVHDARQFLTGFVVLVKDISAMKAIESQLMESSKMAAVGQLASGVAHEFNNLITAISGYAQLMRDNPEERLRRKGVDIILASSERARQLTQNLLTFSRDRGDQPQQLDLNRVIEESLQLVEQQLRADGIRVERESGELELTWGARGPLQQLFLNLITNARHALMEKFDRRGGTLRLSTRQFGETLEASVVDDGVGIPADRVGRIFEPFYTTKGPLGGKSTPGTGLGLYSVYNVVTAHGGRVDVESEPGVGTTFRISLPVRRTRPQAQAA